MKQNSFIMPSIPTIIIFVFLKVLSCDFTLSMNFILLVNCELCVDCWIILVMSVFRGYVDHVIAPYFTYEDDYAELVDSVDCIY